LFYVVLLGIRAFGYMRFSVEALFGIRAFGYTRLWVRKPEFNCISMNIKIFSPNPATFTQLKGNLPLLYAQFSPTSSSS
jgi:hypothetical protein